VKTNLQITDIIAANASESESIWISEQLLLEGKALGLAFVKVPRFVSKRQITEGPFQNWNLDQVVRLAILTKLDEKQVDLLFETAEMQEAVALTKSLPYLAKPLNFCCERPTPSAPIWAQFLMQSHLITHIQKIISVKQPGTNWF